MDKKSKTLIIILSIMLGVMFITSAFAIGYIITNSNQAGAPEKDTSISSEVFSNTETGNNSVLGEGTQTKASIPSTNTEGVRMVIDGYQFFVPSDYSCMYAEGVGPVVYMSDVFQLRIIVKGRPFDELIKSPDTLTSAATDAGATLLQDVTQVEINGNSYVYFKINLSGEDEIVCYADVPDHKTHLGGQIIVQSDAVSDEDLVQMFASIAETAAVTDEPNSTADDINDQFNAVFGTAKETSSLTFEATTVNYKVAAGYYSTSIFNDEVSATECFDGLNSDVMVCLYKTEGENARYYAEVAALANEENGAELSEKTVDGKTVYCCSYSYVYNDVSYNYVEAFCDINPDVYYTVLLDSRGENALDFEMISDFFIFNE